MIPYLLAAVGGYLIGQSQKKDVPQMAKGGNSEDYYEDLRVYVQGVGEIHNGKSMKAAIEAAENYRKKHPYADVAIVDEKYGDEYDLYGHKMDDEEYAKGGKVKSKKWIQDALSGGNNKGALRRTAKRKGLLRGDENLSMTDLKKLEKMGGTTAKRAYMAETLRKFD